MQRDGGLLLCCSSVRPAAESSAGIEALLAERLDWPWIVATARLHGVGPLVYSHLSARGPDRLEHTPLENLREPFQRDVRRSFLMSQELLAVLELFSEHEIPALSYKGPVLAAAEYGNLALRPFCDLDILIREEDITRAAALLTARGYVPEYQLGPLHERAWLRARNDINLRHPDLDVVVELHWEVVPRRLCVPFDQARLWGQTQTVSIGGRQIQTLSPANLLLVLCVHGAKHGWSRLMWIADIAVIVTNHPDLDWADLFSEARRTGIERMLTVGLRLANDVVGCELPPRVRTLTGHRTTVALAKDLRARLFETAADGHDAFQRSWFHVKIRERLRDKVRFTLYTVIVPSGTDRLLVPLPLSLTIVYYLLRPVRLAWKYLWRPVVSRIAPGPQSS